jgi:prophage regulatory protein
MKRLPTRTKGPIRVGAAGNSGQLTESAAVSGEGLTAAPDVTPSAPTLLRLLRFKAVQERTGLSRSTIWRLERRGAFPRHRRISANAVAWVEDEVVRWICSKVDDVA